MDEYYETEDTYTRVEIDAFAQFLDNNIGTDYDINESASGIPDNFYIIVCDLRQSEVTKIRQYEMGLEKC